MNTEVCNIDAQNQALLELADLGQGITQAIENIEKANLIVKEQMLALRYLPQENHPYEVKHISKIRNTIFKDINGALGLLFNCIYMHIEDAHWYFGPAPNVKVAHAMRQALCQVILTEVEEYKNNEGTQKMLFPQHYSRPDGSEYRKKLEGDCARKIKGLMQTRRKEIEIITGRDTAYMLQDRTHMTFKQMVRNKEITEEQLKAS